MLDSPQDFDRLSAFFYLLERAVVHPYVPADIGSLVTKAELVNLAELRQEAAAQIVPREQAELEVPGLDPEQQVTHAQLANIRAYRLTGIGAPARMAVSSLTTHGPHGSNHPDDHSGRMLPHVAPRVGDHVTELVHQVADRIARHQAEAEAS